MTHDELIAEICKRADDRRLLWHYCSDSRRCRGFAGFPDLVVSGLYGTVFLEVKTKGDGRSSQQTTWTYTLLAGGSLCSIIYEDDIASGFLMQLFDQLAGIKAIAHQ